MAAVSAYPAYMTVEEFAEYPFPDGKVELVRGEPRVMPPAGAPHGRVQSNLARLLLPFVHEHRLGWVFNDGLGIELMALPRTVRNPDLSFVRASRLPRGGVSQGFLKVPPDLAVEVLSPSETKRDVEDKLADYRACGTVLLWVIDPKRRTVTVLSGDEPARVLTIDDTLDGGDVIPGFSCRVAELFEGLAQ